LPQETILLTGAAGFIGSHTADALLAAGHRVVGVDKFSDFYPPAWKQANVRALAHADRLDLRRLDITDAPAIERLFAELRPSAVIHLAALAGVRPSIERPADYAHVNVTGTTHLLRSAVASGARKFLFASSSSIYGNNAKVPFSEEDPVEHPISPYAATKRAGELIAHTFWHLHRLPVFCLRFFTVYGPRQRPDLAIHKFARLIEAGRPIPVFGDGSTSRDYTYISDIVDGILAALERCDRYRIYNLGGSHPVTLTDLIEGIEQAMGRKAIIDRRPAQPGDVERTYADVSRSQRELGYAPKVSLPEGLERFVAWFKANREVYR
jgi:UDP-glucuronate 4-epimerase